MMKRRVSEYSGHQTKLRNKRRLSIANNEDCGGWVKHTDYHWSRTVNDKRLDFWPSTSRFKYNDVLYRELYSGRVGVNGYDGTVYDFIARQEE